MMKRYLGNSYERNDDYDSDNAVNGHVMMMLRLMVILCRNQDGDDDIIVNSIFIMMMVLMMILTRRYVG